VGSGWIFLASKEAISDSNNPPQVSSSLNSIFILFSKQTIFRSSGVLKPREMCLVLGCPGSGCSTFLKTIADQRDGYLNVSGEVLYAGIDANEMLKHYKGEVVYNQEG
jgi:ABC-type multidrug transport system ATPase subunit